MFDFEDNPRINYRMHLFHCRHHHPVPEFDQTTTFIVFVRLALLDRGLVLSWRIIRGGLDTVVYPRPYITGRMAKPVSLYRRARVIVQSIQYQEFFLVHYRIAHAARNWNCTDVSEHIFSPECMLINIEIREVQELRLSDFKTFADFKSFNKIQ